MRYKRDEAFRYEFGTPLEAFFTIEEVNGNSVESSEGEASIIDLSLNGMKLATTLEMSNRNDIKVLIRFMLNDNEYLVQGEIIWSKAHLDEYNYGIQFALDEQVQDNLIDDLKELGKSKVND
ncbi:PilZ domain-containing protein [Lentibacillus sp. Marseille-P4043]|uniref:PilZ domain-containing protein n=1 Tax=Lentibacillus sp. Marseille-P4043 TaxID=2040293 RepID=UPI000D0AE55F|nr:PilZ domain-containing protein [Lentibacillus sp. Marseille-P4043]